MLNRAKVDIITAFYKNKLEEPNMRLGKMELLIL